MDAILAENIFNPKLYAEKNKAIVRFNAATLRSEMG
jgi:hypothetical protein